LATSDEFFLFIDDLIDYLREIVVIILRESRHIIDNGSDIPLMLIYVNLVIVTEM